MWPEIMPRSTFRYCKVSFVDGTRAPTWTTADTALFFKTHFHFHNFFNNMFNPWLVAAFSCSYFFSFFILMFTACYTPIPPSICMLLVYFLNTSICSIFHDCQPSLLPTQYSFFHNRIRGMPCSPPPSPLIVAAWGCSLYSQSCWIFCITIAVTPPCVMCPYGAIRSLSHVSWARCLCTVVACQSMWLFDQVACHTPGCFAMRLLLRDGFINFGVNVEQSVCTGSSEARTSDRSYHVGMWCSVMLPFLM